MQIPRVAWYIGHSLVLRELAAHRSEKPKVRHRPRTHAPVPDRKRIYADMAKLFLQDLANVEAGIYPFPADHDGSLFALIRRSRMFFDDLPNIHRRRCGTGRFMDAIKQVWPRLPVLGIDMSEAYLSHVTRYLRRWSRVNLAAAKAESLPVADESQDALISIFLFHELPPSVRRAVLRECARVLKPGGRLVLVDSLQRGDRPDYDGLLELFPESYHEPYYRSYLDEDFAALVARHGLVHVRNVNAFISKVMVIDKQPPNVGLRG